MIPPLLFLALAGLAYALVSARLATSVISTPLFFVGLGLLAGPVLGLVGLRPDSELLVRFLQAALGMMLFVDASSLDLRNGSLKAALAGRLLGIGLPLTVLAGALVAISLWPGIELWQAALVGAMLAPTDALLAHAAVADHRVPAVVRNALNVEGGLNDGLALPLVTIFIAIGLAASGVDTQVRAAQTLVVVIAGSTILGLVVGSAGGGLLRTAARRSLVAPAWWSIGPVAIAVAAFVAADQLGASGFLAVWIAGLAMGRLFRRADEAKAFGLSVSLADGLVAIAFLLLGTALLGPVLARITPQTVIYAVLSLTVVRMLPVAIATLRSGFATGNDPVCRLVRASRPGVGGVRRRCRRAGGARGAGDHRRGARDGGPEHRRPRDHGGVGSPALCRMVRAGLASPSRDARGGGGLPPQPHPAPGAAGRGRAGACRAEVVSGLNLDRRAYPTRQGGVLSTADPTRRPTSPARTMRTIGITSAPTRVYRSVSPPSELATTSAAAMFR